MIYGLDVVNLLSNTRLEEKAHQRCAFYLHTKD